MRLAVLLVLVSAVSAFPKQLNIHPGRDFLSSLISEAFGDDDTTSTAKSTAKSSAVLGSPVTASTTQSTKGKSTLIPPATATPTATPTPSSISSSIASSSSTDTSSITSTLSSTSSSSSTVASSTSTPAPASTSSTQTPTPSTDPLAQPSQSNNSGGGGVSGAGIAVAVILTLVILGCIAWALFRFHPGVRAWWLAREEKRRQERSYRDAIDGPLAQGRGRGLGARDQALGGSRKSVLQSFFTPKTVRLGDGKEIRRKPVNWGAAPDRGSEGGMEKVALTEMAAPMARTGTTKSGISAITAMDRSQSTRSNFSAVSALTTAQPTVGRHKDLPPMPPMPPMPPEPVRTPGPDVHKIFNRKSIYELA